MLPNIDVRIATLVKALEQVILPALPANERLARDQAMLLIGHLHMIGQQWKHALRFECATLDELIRLAAALADVQDGEWGGRLRAAIASAREADRSSVDALEAAYNELGHAVDAVIRSEAPLGPAAVDAILAYGERQAWRERTWFKAVGIDPDRAELPNIEDVLR
jgi:hypothetical protein